VNNQTSTKNNGNPVILFHVYLGLCEIDSTLSERFSDRVSPLRQKDELYNISGLVSQLQLRLKRFSGGNNHFGGKVSQSVFSPLW
jgi:hypothetical protein